jgi:copper chaperone NosL
MRRGVLLAAVLVVTFLAACGGPTTAAGPPEIDLGRDVCDQCHMIISEVRYASAYRTSEGETHLFDDPGGMLVHGVASGELADAQVWVHDYDTEEWLDAASAWFVHGGDIASPMAFRIAAFASESSALAQGDMHGGTVMRWPGLVAMAESGEIAPISDEDLHEHDADSDVGEETT